MPHFHGNAKKNPGIYHLYEIIDKDSGLVFKYGISGDPIDSDGLSKRLREQVEYANLIVGWNRFFGRIVQPKIKGNAAARILEDEFIEQFFEENGKYPIGNRDRK